MTQYCQFLFYIYSYFFSKNLTCWFLCFYLFESIFDWVRLQADLFQSCRRKSTCLLVAPRVKLVSRPSWLRTYFSYLHSRGCGSSVWNCVSGKDRFAFLNCWLPRCRNLNCLYSVLFGALGFPPPSGCWRFRWCLLGGS